MGRDDVLFFLREHKNEIFMFGVEWLSLFGSVARDEGRDDSDIDILVQFLTEPTYDEYCALRLWLEDSLGATVDLVVNAGLRETIRSYVERDAIRVA
jgi:predicted nucleotidyltransferase